MDVTRLKKGVRVKYISSIEGDWVEGIFYSYEADKEYCYVHTNRPSGHSVHGGVEVDSLVILYASALDEVLNVPERERIRFYLPGGTFRYEEPEW